MTHEPVARRLFGRRSVLAGLGGLTGAALLRMKVEAQTDATPVPAWTPPPIPQPLPSSEGTPPPIVGAAVGPPAAPTAMVVLTPDFRFDPQEVTIKPGESVEWRNDGRSPQTVTANPSLVDASLVKLPAGAEPWNSGVLNHGETFVQAFDIPGEYDYASIPRAKDGMTGRVIVKS